MSEENKYTSSSIGEWTVNDNLCSLTAFRDYFKFKISWILEQDRVYTAISFNGKVVEAFFASSIDEAKKLCEDFVSNLRDDLNTQSGDGQKADIKTEEVSND